MRKRVLGAVFCLPLLGKGASGSEVSKFTGLDGKMVEQIVKGLVKDGSLRLRAGRFSLTPKGRKALKVVFIGGGFEVIHLGHLHTIESAKALGDVLVVSVARDSTIRKRKKREPVAGEKERARLLGSLRQVDAAILGVQGDIYETLARVGPDVVALGYDQHHNEAEIRREAARRGMKVKVVRLDSPDPGMKTSKLLSEL